VPRIRERLAAPRLALIASPAEPKPGSSRAKPLHMQGSRHRWRTRTRRLTRAAPLPHELDIGGRRGTCASSEPLFRRENQPTCRPFATIEVEASPPDRPERQRRSAAPGRREDAVVLTIVERLRHPSQIDDPVRTRHPTASAWSFRGIVLCARSRASPLHGHVGQPEDPELPSWSRRASTGARAANAWGASRRIVRSVRWRSGRLSSCGVAAPAAGGAWDTRQQRTSSPIPTVRLSARDAVAVAVDLDAERRWICSSTRSTCRSGGAFRRAAIRTQARACHSGKVRDAVPGDVAHAAIPRLGACTAPGARRRARARPGCAATSRAATSCKAGDRRTSSCPGSASGSSAWARSR
jgi:hypothetical protein